MSGSGHWAGRRVLVTGHTGFKGTWLATWLVRLGAHVTGFGLAPATTPALFELAGIAADLVDRRGDVRDPEAVRRAVREARPEVVFHLAAQPIVRRGLRAPVETFETNVLGTVRLLDALREEGSAAAIVVVTSDKCYAPGVPGHRHVEEDALGGADPYSASKAAQEHVAAAYRRSYALPVATARAGNVIGGGDWSEDRLVPDLVRAAVSGAPLRVRSPEAIRPWQHVLNPLAGYLMLATRLAAGDPVPEACNFGPGADDERPVSWVVERFARAWPSAVPIAEDRDPIPPLEAPPLRVSSALAGRVLGWRPRWDLEAGLTATARWYAAHTAGEDARRLVEADLDAFEPARG